MITENPDMSNVRVGTMVRYRNGRKATVTAFAERTTHPFQTDIGIYHTPSGRCCVKSLPELDIVDILDDEPKNEEVKQEPSIANATIRDMFASSALQGIIANPKLFDACNKMFGNEVDACIAYSAYKYADAMMIARETKKEEQK